MEIPANLLLILHFVSLCNETRNVGVFPNSLVVTRLPEILIDEDFLDACPFCKQDIFGPWKILAWFDSLRGVLTNSDDVSIFLE